MIKNLKLLFIILIGSMTFKYIDSSDKATETYAMTLPDGRALIYDTKNKKIKIIKFNLVTGKIESEKEIDQP